MAERTAELSESEKRYRHIFESSGVSIFEEDFSRVKATIDDAVEFAMNAPDPGPDDATTDLYA